MQAASALRSLRVCSANIRNARPLSALDVAQRGRQQRLGDLFAAADAMNNVGGKPAQDKAADLFGMLDGEDRRNSGPHRIADRIGLRDGQMVEQPVRESSAMVSGS